MNKTANIKVLLFSCLLDLTMGCLEDHNRHRCNMKGIETSLRRFLGSHSWDRRPGVCEVDTVVHNDSRLCSTFDRIRMNTFPSGRTARRDRHSAVPKFLPERVVRVVLKTHFHLTYPCVVGPKWSDYLFLDWTGIDPFLGNGSVWCLLLKVFRGFRCRRRSRGSSGLRNRCSHR